MSHLPDGNPSRVGLGRPEFEVYEQSPPTFHRELNPDLDDRHADDRPPIPTNGNPPNAYDEWDRERETNHLITSVLDPITASAAS